MSNIRYHWACIHYGVFWNTKVQLAHTFNVLSCTQAIVPTTNWFYFNQQMPIVLYFCRHSNLDRTATTTVHYLFSFPLTWYGHIHYSFSLPWQVSYCSWYDKESSSQAHFRLACYSYLPRWVLSADPQRCISSTFLRKSVLSCTTLGLLSNIRIV